MRDHLPRVGDTVVVHSCLTRVFEGSLRLWKREADQPGRVCVARRAVVTGYGHRCDGRLVPGNWENPSSFTQIEKHSVILVRFEAWGKECAALPSDVIACGDDGWEGWEIPHTRNGCYWKREEGERDRANLKAEMSEWPRDSSGRWIPFRLLTVEQVQEITKSKLSGGG